MSAVPPYTYTLALDAGGYILGVAGLVVGALATLAILKTLAQQSVGQARKQADTLLKQARDEAETLKKQIELDSRNDLAQRREAFEKETEQVRNELKENERRLAKREDNLDRKLDTLTTKEKYLDDHDAKIKQREQKLDNREGELEGLIQQYNQLVEDMQAKSKQELLRISNLSEDDAKKEAFKALERENQHEAAQIIQRNMEKAEEEAREHARKVTLQAIQRYASEHTADSTVSTVSIPSDDMKGRVIGREGRNIRAFEKATGVDVIVDDTPGVVVVSCFDPVRRAIAAESLQQAAR